MSASLEPLLSVENLHTSFFTQSGTVKAVQETSFAVRRGEILGIVGESGCGKTTAGLSVMGLVPYPGRRWLAGASIFGEPTWMRWTRMIVGFYAARQWP